MSHREPEKEGDHLEAFEPRVVRCGDIAFIEIEDERVSVCVTGGHMARPPAKRRIVTNLPELN